ncbi:AsmA family protein [Chryseobacterium sp. S-02]|uniref:AsmA family protein n=1 Tax=Chryseobacterium sp. S-02 TaxID=3404064 RepID=UPI003CF33A40
MKKEKTKASFLSKTLKISGISLGSVVLILFVTPYFFKDTINNGIKEVSKSYIKTKVDFKDLDISFFTHFPNLTVTLTNSSVKGNSPFQTENLIDAKEIGLGIDITSLFDEKIVFNTLYIENANIRMKVDSSGRNNFDILVSEGEAKENNDSKLALALKNFRISNSNFIYDDQLSKTYLKLDKLEYNGLIDLTKDILSLDAKTDIKNSFFRLDKDTWVKDLPLKGKINTKINIDQLGFYFTDNPLVLGEFPFNLQGSLKMPNEEQVYDIKITTKNADLKAIPVIIPEAYQEYAKEVEMKGKADLLFTMKGILNASKKQSPDIHIETNINNGSFNYQKSSSPINNLSLTSFIDIPALDPNRLKVKVNELDFSLLNGYTRTNFVFENGPMMFSEGTIDSNINLEALKNATGYKKIDAKGNLKLNGNWKGLISSNAKKTLQKVPLFNIKADLKNGYFKMREMPAALDHINLDMNILNTDGNFKNTAVLVHNIDAKALDNYAKGKIEIKNLYNYPIDADFTAKIHLQDIYKIYPVKGIDLRGDLFVKSKAVGTYEPKRKKVPVSNSTLSLKNGFIQFDDYPELPLENINVETHVKSGRGSFSDLDIRILPISFTLAGKPFTIKANLKNLNNLNYRLHSKGQLNLGDLYKLFPIEGLDINGVVSTDVGLKGQNGTALDNIQNRGFVKIENITIHSKFFPSNFVVKEGLFKLNGSQLTFEDVKARYKKNVFVFNGNVSNYINYILKDQNLSGSINFTSKKVNIDDFMAYSSGESSNSTSAAEGVVLLPKNLDIIVNGNANEILFKDIRLNNFKGNLALKNGNLALNETEFGMIGSTFNADGTYFPVNAKKAKFGINMKAKNFDIQRAYKEITLFREMVSAAEKAYGKVSLDYHLEGDLGADFFPKLKTIKGEGVLTLEDIQFHGFKVFNSVAEKTSTDALHDAKVSKVNIKTSIKDNVITIERTKFKIAGFRPRIEGQVSLDGYINVGMRLGLPPFGIIGIPIKITGPSDTFKVETGKYQKEDLNETDDDYKDYQKSLEEEAAKKAEAEKKDSNTKS